MSREAVLENVRRAVCVPISATKSVMNRHVPLFPDRIRFGNWGPEDTSVSQLSHPGRLHTQF